MNCLVQQSLPETTGEEYSPYRENFHSVEDFMWLDFENVQNLFLIMIAMKKKTATNNSNFPFLSFFFSFSAWFQVFWGGGCWSNVIFNAFTFKKSSRVCIYSHCTLPTLETLRVFKIGRLLNCAAFPAFRSVPWSVSIIFNTQALLQLTIIICFSWKFCVLFYSPAVSVALYSQTLVKNLVWRAWVQCSSFLANYA